MGCFTESLVLFTKYHLFKLKYVHVVEGLKEEELGRQTILSLPFATVMWRAIKMKPHLHNQYQNNICVIDILLYLLLFHKWKRLIRHQMLSFVMLKRRHLLLGCLYRIKFWAQLLKANVLS